MQHRNPVLTKLGPVTTANRNHRQIRIHSFFGRLFYHGALQFENNLHTKNGRPLNPDFSIGSNFYLHEKFLLAFLVFVTLFTGAQNVGIGLTSGINARLIAKADSGSNTFLSGYEVY